jgi:hypothetical protein
MRRGTKSEHHTISPPPPPHTHMHTHGCLCTRARKHNSPTREAARGTIHRPADGELRAMVKCQSVPQQGGGSEPCANAKYTEALKQCPHTHRLTTRAPT